MRPLVLSSNSSRPRESLAATWTPWGLLRFWPRTVHDSQQLAAGRVLEHPGGDVVAAGIVVGALEDVVADHVGEGGESGRRDQGQDRDRSPLGGRCRRGCQG